MRCSSSEILPGSPPVRDDRGHHGVSAALEFAVTQLKVGEILVMGHGLCGGCAAALTGQFDELEPGSATSSRTGFMLDDASWAVRDRHDTLDRDAYTDMGTRGGEGQPCEPAYIP